MGCVNSRKLPNIIDIGIYIVYTNDKKDIQGEV